MKRSVTVEFLVKSGFLKLGRTEYYFKRISDDVVLAYDTVDGFMEVRRHRANRKRDSELMICLPKPYRTKKEFNAFLSVILP